MTPAIRPLRPNPEAQRQVARSTIRDLDVLSFSVLSVDDIRPPRASQVHPLDPGRQQRPSATVVGPSPETIHGRQFAAEGSDPHLRTGHRAFTDMERQPYTDRDIRGAVDSLSVRCQPRPDGLE
ncbi:MULTISPECIES: hypothetical protein [Paenarthrobacter]|uniref:Uncharacterized protein n=1 Tax=Paenarthrobacter aromaticivorans TaxID=2849150 RepID=A0ABS6I6P9_9MICC|nr:hypothetical protein [Paenarthrobacter sp. MMS21-TAE1-1]MBU8866769.1 hypothetical protein [Paenarthrobacter sp. MMS21-TAE1-1]